MIKDTCGRRFPREKIRRNILNAKSLTNYFLSSLYWQNCMIITILHRKIYFMLLLTTKGTHENPTFRCPDLVIESGSLVEPANLVKTSIFSQLISRGEERANSNRSIFGSSCEQMQIWLQVIFAFPKAIYSLLQGRRVTPYGSIQKVLFIRLFCPKL